MGRIRFGLIFLGLFLSLSCAWAKATFSPENLPPSQPTSPQAAINPLPPVTNPPVGPGKSEKAPPVSPAPLVQPAPPSSSAALVQPADFTYLGAFRLPQGDTRPKTFLYGGNAMTFNPQGGEETPQREPGTLFISGHERLPYGELPDGDQIAEITIPKPVISRAIADLPAAEFVQDFQDVAKGYFQGLDEIPRLGMVYLYHPTAGPKIYLAWGQHLQPETSQGTHAWFDLNLSNPNMQGTWFIGNQSPYSVNGYMFEIPAAWAEQYSAGQRLATGRFRDGGWSGMGPALFAYTPWANESGASPAPGAHLSETVLLHYDSSETTDSIEHCLNGYQHPDEWEGGAWLTTRSAKTGVLFAGTKGTGSKYWYGWVNPASETTPCVEAELIDQMTTCRLADGTLCPKEDLGGCQGHNDFRGWWSTRFDAQIILYNPDDLARVAAGELQSWEPQPYAVLDIDEYLYFNPTGVEIDMIGKGDQRRFRIGDVAYDRANDLLYVLELYADDARPVVHVWQIK